MMTEKSAHTLNKFQWKRLNDNDYYIISGSEKNRSGIVDAFVSSTGSQLCSFFGTMPLLTLAPARSSHYHCCRWYLIMLMLIREYIVLPQYSHWKRDVCECVKLLCDFMLIVLLNHITIQLFLLLLLLLSLNFVPFVCLCVFHVVFFLPKCLLPCLIAPSEITITQHNKGK